MAHLNLGTDFFNGKNDLLGPYPRIPDKEKLKVILAERLMQFFQARDGS